MCFGLLVTIIDWYLSVWPFVPLFWISYVRTKNMEKLGHRQVPFFWNPKWACFICTNDSRCLIGLKTRQHFRQHYKSRRSRLNTLTFCASYTNVLSNSESSSFLRIFSSRFWSKSSSSGFLKFNMKIDKSNMVWSTYKNFNMCHIATNWCTARDQWNCLACTTTFCIAVGDWIFQCDT